MKNWILDMWRVPASAKDAFTQLALGVGSGLAVVNAIGWPNQPKEWFAVAAAMLAGWAGMTKNAS